MKNSDSTKNKCSKTSLADSCQSEEKVSAITRCPVYRGFNKNPRWGTTTAWR